MLFIAKYKPAFLVVRQFIAYFLIIGQLRV